MWEIGATGTRAVGATLFNTNPQVQAYAKATRNGNYINGFTNIAYNNANNTSGQSYSTTLDKYDTKVAWETRGIVIDNLRHTLDLNWEINDTFRVRGISGYKEISRVTQVDFDGAAEVVLLERLNNNRTISFSQELQVLGSHEKVDWVVGAFYQALTQFIGFPHYGDEYKIMGLAPYGEPSYLEQMRQIVKLETDGGYRLNLDYFRHHREKIDYEWENGEPSVGTLFSPELARLLGPARDRSEPLEQHHRDIARSVKAM